MKRLIYILLPLSLLVGCSKDDNPLDGTSWLSTYSSECAWENDNLDGDFSEVMTFDDKHVQSKTLKNGYVYRNNWSNEYAYSDGLVTIYSTLDTVEFHVRGNEMWQVRGGGMYNYIFYKQ